jgi:hypothetical protein
MKRTLLAVGVAVLISMMLIPRAYCYPWFGHWILRCDAPTEWLPFFMESPNERPIHWPMFELQTVFAAVLAAVIVNIPWRRGGGKKP